ncbi:MAG: hypothetical protein Q9220_002708 [cf. Caloplaca sp. 1 TL-2023]
MDRTATSVGSYYGSSNGLMQSQPMAAYPGSSYGARNGLVSSQQYPVPVKQSYSAANPYNFGNSNEDMPDQYAQSPPYLLPSQDSQTSASAYGMQDTNRLWTPIVSSRHQVNTSGYENDPSLRYGASNFPYLNPSAAAGIGPEDSLFPGAASLDRNLPGPSSRTLPTPKTNATFNKSGEFASSGLPSGLSCKSSRAWSPQTLMPRGSQGSVSSTSLSTFGEPVRAVSSSSPAERDPGTTTFGYVSVSSSPLRKAAPAAGLHPTTFGYSSLAPAPLLSGRGSLPLRTSSSYSPSLYGWTGVAAGSSHSAESSSSGTTLVSGKTYQPLRQAPVKQIPPESLPYEKPPNILPAQKSTSVTTQTQHR